MRLGILLEDTTANQLAYFAISQINEVVKKSCVIQPLCATMNSSEIWNFDGVLLSTTVSNTLTSLKAITPKRKYFYVWDLEWNRNHGKDFESSIEAYTNPEISLIARGLDHTKAIENYCNKKVCGSVSNFNLKQLMDLINHE